MAVLRKTGTGIAIGGIAIAGVAGIMLLALVLTLVSALMWAVIIFYGSMILHHMWPDTIPSATFLEAFGIGFVLGLLRSVFSSTVVTK